MRESGQYYSGSIDIYFMGISTIYGGLKAPCIYDYMRVSRYPAYSVSIDIYFMCISTIYQGLKVPCIYDYMRV